MTDSETKFFGNLARASAGAVLFSLPVLMTMEMWELGFHMDGVRLALFTLVTIPLLIGLSYYDGFEPTSCLTDDVVGTFVAYAVGFVTAGAVLYLFGVISVSMSVREIVGKIALQAVIGAFGAMFAQSLLIGSANDRENGAETDDNDDPKRDASYFGEIFLMAIGAIYMSMSVAPTEEMILIAYQMSYVQTFFLIVVTLGLMQAFFYAVEFRGGLTTRGGSKTFTNVFVKFTSVGYAISLLISWYLLWTFGSIDGTDFNEVLKSAVVLAFPAAVGASASRFIL